RGAIERRLARRHEERGHARNDGRHDHRPLAPPYDREVVRDRGRTVLELSHRGLSLLLAAVFPSQGSPRAGKVSADTRELTVAAGLAVFQPERKVLPPNRGISSGRRTVLEKATRKQEGRHRCGALAGLAAAGVIPKQCCGLIAQSRARNSC